MGIGPEVRTLTEQIDRLTRRQIRLALVAESGLRPKEISEWEAVLLVRWIEYVCWLDARELRKQGIDVWC